MLWNFFLTFPNFNIYSTPLLILVIQGLIFAVLLLLRYQKKKRLSDLLLALILIITCYHRTTYTIGFMDWYDTFPNTKINYYLVDLSLLLAPLVYFYVKSVTQANFKFRKKDRWHFIPVIIFVLFKFFVLGFDAMQPGFSETQNGYLVENLQWKYIDPVRVLISNAQMILYLAFTFQLFYGYRKKIQHYFSNTFQLELNWLRNFLFVYTFLYVYSVFQLLIDIAITELSWTQAWWYQFISALVIVYVGIKGYFTETYKLLDVVISEDYFEAPSRISEMKKSVPLPVEIERSMETVTSYFNTERPYLNPDLTLTDLANQLHMSRAELSEVINTGYQQNFNDFVNQFRVENVKQLIHQGKHQQLSLLGLAFDSGFNSKATFNRVFKKFTKTSPSQYIAANK